MSQHPSLKTSKAGKRHRTVLKRFEKFFALKEKGIIKDEDSIFGLPKLKIVRTKIKKEKAEEKPEEGQVAAEGAVPAPGAGAKKEPEAKGKKEDKKDKK
ncbi:MAG: small basic protein [Candidatus Gorgyraea atricola]|nr:small basic protein [Candidatus Gorgyraea atricola]